MLTVTNELGHVTTMTYDNKNAILTAEDELGNTTTYTYDTKGNLTAIEDAQLNVTAYAYDEADPWSRWKMPSARRLPTSTTATGTGRGLRTPAASRPITPTTRSTA